MSERRPFHSGVAHMIEDCCAAKGWTLAQFCAHAGVNTSTVYRVSQRSYCPTDKTVRGIAKTLGMSVSKRETLLVPTEVERLTAEIKQMRARALEQGVKL